MNFRKAIIFILLLFLSEQSTFAQSDSVDGDWELVFGGLDFPEGPAFDNSGNLYVSNCYGSWIARFDGKNVDTFLVKSDQYPSIDKTNGLTIFNDYLYACDYGLGAILKISMRGEIEIIAEGFNRPNDLVSYGKNLILFTDPKGYGKEIFDGRVFSLNIETNTVKLIADGLAFPNGINISPIDNRVYICESANERVVRFEMNEDGLLINKEVFIELPGGDPDGIEFDENGNLFIAHFGGKAVYIVSPNGQIIRKIETPGKKPTNLEFGDIEKRILYITEVETNSVYKMILQNSEE
ncbi:MAG: SMP-30/gluconolactonase/LRE family protein [Ignavibacteriaceae bacterium]